MNQYCIKLISVFLILNLELFAQTSTYQISTIAFYNVENLFDSINDKNTYDGDYTPTGKKLWTNERLNTKLDHLSYAISQIGLKETEKAPAIIGLAEIENKEVLLRLIAQKHLTTTDYDIAHFNSPDKRGIDVALLYDRNRFKLTNSQKHVLLLKDSDGNRVFTRDQLCVSGFLGSDLMYFVVNHWPSRRGGEKRSRSKRVQAAKLCLKITDSIYAITPKANIVLLGDFNDDPTDSSFKKVLKTKSSKTYKSSNHFYYNPMEKMKKLGYGTLAYRDKWNIFDQLLFSNALLDSTGIKLYKTAIFKPKYLIESKGRYKGYPKRTNLNEVGYSDHFPVYSFLIKRIYK